jgi:hypothetical protein
MSQQLGLCQLCPPPQPGACHHPAAPWNPGLAKNMCCCCGCSHVVWCVVPSCHVDTAAGATPLCCLLPHPKHNRRAPIRAAGPHNSSTGLPAGTMPCWRGLHGCACVSQRAQQSGVSTSCRHRCYNHLQQGHTNGRAHHPGRPKQQGWVAGCSPSSLHTCTQGCSVGRSAQQQETLQRLCHGSGPQSNPCRTSAQQALSPGPALLRPWQAGLPLQSATWKALPSTQRGSQYEWGMPHEAAQLQACVAERTPAACWHLLRQTPSRKRPTRARMLCEHL